MHSIVCRFGHFGEGSFFATLVKSALLGRKMHAHDDRIARHVVPPTDWVSISSWSPAFLFLALQYGYQTGILLKEVFPVCNTDGCGGMEG